jgi:hypothetical protein
MRIGFSKLPFEQYVAEQKKYKLDYETLFSEFKKGYAPLNFDADSKKHARKIARVLMKKYKHYTILFRKSPSRRGYHFTIFQYEQQLFLPIKDVLRIRKKCFDCFGRVRADVVRAKNNLPISILFDSKNMRDATMWKELKKFGDIR